MALSEVRKVEGYQPVKLNHPSTTHLTSFFFQVQRSVLSTKIVLFLGPTLFLYVFQQLLSEAALLNSDQQNFHNKL